MEQQRVASVILQDSNGKVLPVSSQVYRPLQSPVPVGYDGIVYLENLSDVNPLTVTLPDGKRCKATLTLEKNPDRKLKTYGPLECREVGR